MKLNVKAFALACGLMWGIGLFLMTWWVIIFEGASREGTVFGHVFRGYSLTASGSIIGLIWGLVIGAILGAVLAWLYNKMIGREIVKPA
jgi:hypothetical protein